MRFSTSALVVLAVAFAAPAKAADPLGKWVRPSTGTQVDFYACGNKLCGKIVGVRDTSRTKEIGTIILNGAVKSGDQNGC